jgi:O-antigen/teichoic acid export membrane protein
MRGAILFSGVGVGAVRLAGMGLGLLVTVIIGRALGPAGLGAYGYAVLVLTLLGVPISYGWSTLVLRRIASARQTSHWSEAKGMIVRGSLFAAAAASVVFVGAWAWSQLPSAPLALSHGAIAAALLASILFFDQLSALRLATLRGLDRPVWGQLPEMLLRPLLVISAFSLLAITFGSQVSLQHAFLALAFASVLTAAAGGLVVWRKRPPELARAKSDFRTREWMHAAGLLAANSGLLLLNSNADSLILGALASMHDVGLYRIASQAALLSGFAYTALNMLAAPRFASMRAAGDWKSLQASAVFMARLAFVGALPLPIVFLFFGQPLIHAVFGPGFDAALQPMFVLFVGQAVNAGAGMASSLLMMSGREAQLIRFTAGGVALNATLSLILVPRYGAMGAAVGNLAATVFWNSALWLQTLRLTQVDTSIFGRFGPRGTRE